MQHDARRKINCSTLRRIPLFPQSGREPEEEKEKNRIETTTSAAMLVCMGHKRQEEQPASVPHKSLLATLALHAEYTDLPVARSNLGASTNYYDARVVRCPCATPEVAPHKRECCTRGFRLNTNDKLTVTCHETRSSLRLSIFWPLCWSPSRLLFFFYSLLCIIWGRNATTPARSSRCFGLYSGFLFFRGLLLRFLLGGL